jgi:hypothetical protein
VDKYAVTGNIKRDLYPLPDTLLTGNTQQQEYTRKHNHNMNKRTGAPYIKTDSPAKK